MLRNRCSISSMVKPYSLVEGRLVCRGHDADAEFGKKVISSRVQITREKRQGGVDYKSRMCGSNVHNVHDDLRSGEQNAVDGRKIQPQPTVAQQQQAADHHCCGVTAKLSSSSPLLPDIVRGLLLTNQQSADPCDVIPQPDLVRNLPITTNQLTAEPKLSRGQKTTGFRLDCLQQVETHNRFKLLQIIVENL